MREAGTPVRVSVFDGIEGLEQRIPAVLLLRNSTAKDTKRHKKGKYPTSKYRENTQI
jgi:hypothetical protein